MEMHAGNIVQTFAAACEALNDDTITEGLIADGQVSADVLARRKRFKDAEMDELAHLAKLRVRHVQERVESGLALDRAWDPEPFYAAEDFTKRQIVRTEWRHGKLQRARRRFDHRYILVPLLREGR